MSILLDVAYLAGVGLASPLLAYKALSSEKYRSGFPERFGRVAPRAGQAPCVWVHAVSVGEMSLARPLVEEVERRWPGWEVVLSTATNTGLATARRLYPERRAIYYPLDFSWMVARAFRAVRPDVVLLVELEVWPNFLAEAARRGVPVAVVNGRVSERAFRRYRLVRPLVRRWLRGVARFCVQSETYGQRLAALGAPRERVVVTGNLKFDACAGPQGAAGFGELAAGLGLEPGEPLLVAGCTWPGEDEAVLEVYRRLREGFPELRLLLAPRQAERFDAVERLVRAEGLACVRRTALQGGVAARSDAVVLLDTVGELARVYALAMVVFVGGSLTPRGGHNTLEAASMGKPVLFGPHTDNFRDVNEELVAHGGARRVGDAAELEAAVRELLARPAEAQAMGQRGRQVVERHRGAARRTAEALEAYFRERNPEGSNGR
ncbi:MAG: 3-deoxy-D-manno-octulosonic acid transferase [bacterium]